MKYVTSDLHFCHNRDFIYKARGFSSKEEHDEAIIKNWNEIVKPKDKVYVLGDMMLNDNITGIENIKRLNGQLYIIGGNHDTPTRMALYEKCPNVICVNVRLCLTHNNYFFYLTHYPTITDNHDNDKPLKKRIINLCGHNHTTDPFADFDKGLIYHCELDAHNMKPILIDDIPEQIERRLQNDSQSKNEI